MSFTQTITDEMKTAMKSGDKVRLETIRSLRALILEFEKSGAGREMNDDDAQNILISAAKKRKDAIEQYRSAGREDLAQKEEAELVIIQEFLPQQLSAEQVSSRIKEIISEVGAVGAKDFGKVMGVAMKEMRGKADGTLIQSTVKELLA